MTINDFLVALDDTMDASMTEEQRVSVMKWFDEFFAVRPNVIGENEG